MKKTVQAAGSILFSLVLLLGLLTGSVLAVAGNAGYMHTLFLRHADPAVTGVDTKDYQALADKITVYLMGSDNTFQTTISVHGQMREAFSEKELAHMQDVKILFTLCRTLLFICLAAVLLTFLAAIRFRGMAKPLAKGFLATGTFIALLGGALAVWATADFDGLFTLFHHLFFTNDLWLLNPNQDLLLQLMPTAFFIDYAIIIGLCWLLGTAIVAAAALITLRRRKQKA